MPTPHSTDNYTVGKGILYIAPWSGTTPPSQGAFTEIGNCPSVSLTPGSERLDHMSSRSGLRNKDKNPIIETTYTLEFTCDEMAASNLAKYLLGTKSGNQIFGLQNANAEYALKFISDNPIGPNATWQFHRVSLSPNGALELIGDEWMEMSYTADGLSDAANNPTSPYFTVTYATTTTTTTT